MPATLTKRREFTTVAKKGAHVVTAGLILQMARRRDEGLARIGYTVSAKVGNAVVRNRVKRRLRALWQEIAPQFMQAGCDYVLIGRRAAFDRLYEKLKRDLVFAFHQIHR